VHVDLGGRVKMLMRSQWMGRLLPSPDGRYLAYQAETTDSNVWMLENF